MNYFGTKCVYHPILGTIDENKFNEIINDPENSNDPELLNYEACEWYKSIDCEIGHIIELPKIDDEYLDTYDKNIMLKNDAYNILFYA